MTDREFETARRREAWHRVLALITGKSTVLLPFDLVRSKLELRSGTYEGIREIPIDKVIGSVNRYHDFDREFLPRLAESQERWSRVRKTLEEGPGYPPILVYQVGEAYFVVDGNHRVSAARSLGATQIEAEVIRFEPNVPIDEHTDVAELIRKSEYSTFLKQTRLDVLRPDQRIEFSRPGQYAVLLEHIEKHRYFMGLDKRRDIPYEEAVCSWYDHLYEPLVGIFRQEGLLELFPGRTAADLYVWVARHLYELRQRYGDGVPLAAAARDLAEQRRRGSWLRRVVRRFGRIRRGGDPFGGTEH